MDRSSHWVCRFLATGASLALLALGGPSSAGTLASSQDIHGAGAAAIFLAQAGPTGTAPAPPPSRGEATHKKRSKADRVETRLEDLHRNLKITADQEPQWRDFAQVMRDNAHALDAILEERRAKLSKMNAVDDLRSYEKLADAHADGLKKLVPAFEALYNTMSEDQKKNADAAFSHFEGRPRHSKE